MSGRGGARCWRGLAMAALGLAPMSAHAHLVQTGFGTFYDGMAHVVLAPADTLLVLAFSLFIGTRETATARRSVLTFAGAWSSACLVGLLWPIVVLPTWAVASGFGVLGALVAMRTPIAASVVVGMAAIVGAAHGYRQGVAAQSEAQDWLSLLGAFTLVFVLTTVLAAIVVSRSSDLARIVIRVIGSWLAAIAILTLGWTWRPHRLSRDGGVPTGASALSTTPGDARPGPAERAAPLQP